MGKAKSKELNKYFLKLSNKLSEINQFETFPNPCVGAVLVYKNNISTSYLFHCFGFNVSCFSLPQ